MKFRKYAILPILLNAATEKRVVLIIAVLAGFITPFDGSAVNIALPTMGAEFHMNAIALSWVATAYLLSSAVFLVPFGKIADIYGRKKVFLYGIAIFSLASLLMTMVPSTEIFIGIRVFQGARECYDLRNWCCYRYLRVSPERAWEGSRDLYNCGLPGALPWSFPWRFNDEYLGWRSIFFVNVPIGIVAVILILWKLKGEWARVQGREVRPDRVFYLQCSSRCCHVRVFNSPGIKRSCSYSIRTYRNYYLCPLRDADTFSRP